MINVSGFKIFPNEVEQILSLHKKVKEAVVVGVRTDDSVQEIVKAVIIKKSKNLTKEEIKNHCRKYLTPYKVPKIIEFKKFLPKTSVGKIIRQHLKSKA